jgi:hypothetical protein
MLAFFHHNGTPKSGRKGMTCQAQDTSPDVQKIIIEGYRRMSPQQKIKRVSELTKAVQQLALARIRKQYGILLKSDIASQEEMARREQYQIAENSQHMLFLASAEDVIVHKLYWYQLGGEVSERQWNDVLGVLQVQQNQLDRAYLKRAAQHRGVVALLKQALKAAEIG